MEISLSPNNEKYIQSQIAAGIYDSINEAINATISIAISNISIPEEKIVSLKEDIKKGLDDVEAGRVHNALVFMDKLIEEDEQI